MKRTALPSEEKCGASIAKRDSSHRPCVLKPNHQGDCAPFALAVVDAGGELDAAAISGPLGDVGAAARYAEWSEGQFVRHVLAVVESAGDSLTYVEACNLAVALLRARLGLPGGAL